ncbi:aminoglycoside phosphotransferase family protein [Halobacillus sp. GSS1]|uniref:aminoglycoside phosphotransferase family protein n=1 Tax=Halobacillus sp. GSS1 TaxID=2815919 RepID=UPI001A904CB9|nr:aminoglycoside phosphotransferase family protein [Halobacillus sp. GSS1]MBN9653986.1 aminoglycoside phosphotransferase family protein [Halobacillus sp. GSS1]
MTDQKVESRLKKWAEKAELGLESENIYIEYIWNPGGFVNQSYQIYDGKKRMHVKFAKKNHMDRLKQWARLNEYLRENYHAPKLLLEIHETVIPDHPYGLVFEFFEGDAWKGDVWTDNILAKVGQLHGDSQLKQEIGAGDQTCADAMTDTYIRRLREDMCIINAHKISLPFVKKNTFDWFHEVTDDLEKEIQQSIHFQRPAEDIVHNDLSQQNILVNDEEFCIIDWDDLTLGDAAADYASLLWAWFDTDEWTLWEGKVRVLAGDAVVERMKLYFKAKLLDDIIDVLADYVEAENFPEVKEQTQQRAKATHLMALEIYKARYEKSSL